MVEAGLQQAYEEGIKVWVYIRDRVIAGWVTKMDADYIELTRLPSETPTRERYIIRLDRIDLISLGDVEEWNPSRLNSLLVEGER
jgi:hypothetical protein